MKRMLSILIMVAGGLAEQLFVNKVLDWWKNLC